MRNAAIVVATLVVLTALAVVGMLVLSNHASRRADAVFNAVEPDDAFRARYPALSSKNASAAALEQLADGVSLDLRPRVSMSPRRPTDGDETVMQAMTSWLKSQHERPADTIVPPSDTVRAWLDAHAAPIDVLATHLDTAEVPQWPVVQTGARSEQPLPNLLGHMKLLRVLSVAALDAEAKGDHDRAWRLQHAAWKLTQGLGRRPEIISQLIAVAGVRMLAGTARKLEAPVPPWFSEVATLRPRDDMYRAYRYEMNAARSSVRDAMLVMGSDHDAASLGARIEAVAMAPVLQWAATEVVSVTASEFNTLRTGDPCSVDARAAMQRSRARLSPVVRRFGDTTMGNIASTFGRAAAAEIAIEGTSKVLAAKQARQSAQPWPTQLPGIERSACKDAQWIYSPNDASLPLLRFNGRAPQVDVAGATRIPTEYVAR